MALQCEDQHLLLDAESEGKRRGDINLCLIESILLYRNLYHLKLDFQFEKDVFGADVVCQSAVPIEQGLRTQTFLIQRFVKP